MKNYLAPVLFSLSTVLACSQAYAGGYDITSDSTVNHLSNGSTVVDSAYLSSSDTLSLSSSTSALDFYIDPEVTGTYSIAYQGVNEYFDVMLVYGGTFSSVTYLPHSISGITFVGSSGTTPTFNGGEVQYVSGTGFSVFLSFIVTDDFTFSSMYFDVTGLSGELGTDSFTLSSTSSRSYVTYLTSDNLNLMTFTPVPEPASYAAIFGFFGLGGAMILRRRAGLSK
jgi:hypothetical protein